MAWYGIQCAVHSISVCPNGKWQIKIVTISWKRERIKEMTTTTKKIYEKQPNENIMPMGQWCAYPQLSILLFEYVCNIVANKSEGESNSANNK